MTELIAGSSCGFWKPLAGPPNAVKQCGNCKWAAENENRYDQVRCCCSDSPNAWGDVEVTDCCNCFVPNAAPYGRDDQREERTVNEPVRLLFGASVVRVDGFRSIPRVNADEDMVRVTMDMPKHTWRELQRLLPPNSGHTPKSL
jgi:hypothetical protein